MDPELLAKANNGDADAQADVADLYYDGKAVPQDYSKALEYATKSAAQGNSEGQNLVGILYVNGFGVAKDKAKAEEFFLQSASQGYTSAYVNLGDVYQRRNNITKAKEWFERAANLGDANGQYKLGYLYKDAQDYAKAVEWLTKSSDQGNARAQYALGKLYYDGKGVTQDYSKAFEFYSKSEASGYEFGSFNMGFMYEYGDGVAQDFGKAIECYIRASNGGCKSAHEEAERLAKKHPEAIPKQTPTVTQAVTTAAAPSPAVPLPQPSKTAVTPAQLSPAPLPSKVEDWSVNNVITWMTSLGLSLSYNDLIRSNGIDGKVVVEMAKENWKEMGITAVGDLIKLSKKPSAPTQSTTTTPTAQPISQTATTPTTQTQPLQKVGSSSTKGVYNRSKDTDALSDVGYKKVIDLVSACKPELSCREHMINDLPKVLTKVPDINSIVEECLPVVESCLQRYRPAPGHSSLNEDEALAIAAFSFDLGIAETHKNLYHDLNTVMRERKPTKMQLLTPFLTYMVHGITKLPAIEATVYRGLPISSLKLVEENYRKGTNIHWSGFTSTTSNIKIAQNFAGEGGIIMRIDIMSGRSIKPFSAIQTEDEVLLSPNIKLFVNKPAHKGTDEYLYLDLTEVAQTASFVF